MRKIIFKAVLILGTAFFVGCEEGGFSLSFSDKPIGIQPFGSVDQQEIDSVKHAIEQMYDKEVVVLDYKKLPDMAYTEIRYPRYRADSLVQWLADHKPDSLSIIFGLTDQDISITKYKDRNKGIIKEPEWQYKDFGIFGLGRVGGESCVVSSNRLHKGVSDALFYKRLCRISCHEIGHVLGLHHCPEKDCLMNDANESIKTIDNSTGELCNKCWRKIR